MGNAEIQDGAGPATNFKTVGSGDIKNIGLANIRKNIVKETILKWGSFGNIRPGSH